MAERIKAEHRLVDAWTAELGGSRTAKLFNRLDKAVAWHKLVEPIAALPEYRGAAMGPAAGAANAKAPHHNPQQNKGGRPAWRALTMLKCLMLPKWFGLSDPQPEECLQKRLSFRRFVGLSLNDATPGYTTFVRFRARLREANLDRQLFDATRDELDRRGLLVKDGSLVDAMIIEQVRGHKREDGTSTRDVEASFTKKNGRTCHGYKGSVNADRSALVVEYCFSDTASHESNFINELTANETKMIVAHIAYWSCEREEALRPRGVMCAFAFKRKKGHVELPPQLKRMSELAAPIRAKVGHVFAWPRPMGYRRVRYRGERRNELDFALNLIAYNWKRSQSLSERRVLATERRGVSIIPLHVDGWSGCSAVHQKYPP